jgi:hypothetical protein
MAIATLIPSMMPPAFSCCINLCIGSTTRSMGYCFCFAIIVFPDKILKGVTIVFKIGGLR